LALNDAQIKELIINLGYQADNKSISCASLLCSDSNNNLLNCRLFHASGLIIIDNSPESLPHQKDLLNWVLQRFTTPERVQCAISTLYFLATTIEQKVNHDNELHDDNSAANSDPKASYKAYNNIILYAMYLLNNRSINQSILERAKDNSGVFDDIHIQYIQEYYTNKTKCQDDEITFSNLIVSIFQAICRWIEQVTISKELEQTLIYNSIPKLVSSKSLNPHLYISHLSGVFEANTVKIAEFVWPNWEKEDNSLCVRRTTTVSHSNDLTAKLSAWLDARQQKEYLIRGIRSLSKASVFIIEESD